MIDEVKSKEIDKGFQQWFKDREYNCIQWSDGKYLKDMLPKGKMGHYVPIIRHKEIESRLLFLIKLIQEPVKDLPDEAVIMAERKKFYKHLETAFKDIMPKSFGQFYEEYK